MTKSELRIIVKQKRLLLKKNQVDQLSIKCFSNLLSKFTFKEKNIGIFFPITNSNEPNTFLFYEELIKLESNVFLPVVDFASLSMDFYLPNSISNLNISKYGVPEPQSINKINPKKLDVLLVPLLAIDKNGYRVGYGKGFYDRYIPRCSGEITTIGINLFEDVYEILDLSKNDAPLKYCVTPSNIKHYL
ncbi:MAG: 5-formyltetrahydrofolate cyclo-ligase [Crocinitomicaceae bacterium]|nr:5-formyltetrahydrofolate cyclo-ligase [Crocinitomicaceae bacterium]